MRRPLNISDDIGDAVNIGGGVAATVFVAPNGVAIVFVDAGGSKLARSKKYIYI
jgi:hypothetical protein